MVLGSHIIGVGTTGAPGAGTPAAMFSVCIIYDISLALAYRSIESPPPLY